jgi:hypothetical protein
MARFSTLVRAFGTLTCTGQPGDTDTVVIGGKTYTYETSLTNVDGHVLIGADLAESIANLVAAIELGAGSGTKYAASTTAHPHVRVKSSSATVLVVESKVTGAIGNLIATTETHDNGSWGGAVLASGSGSIATLITELRSSAQANSDILQVLDTIDGSSASEV